MNRFLFPILILAVLFFTYSSLPTEIFTKEERDLILNAIDNTCADSWCEGEYEYEFIKIACNKLNHSCLLQYYLASDESTRLLNYEKKFCRIYDINNIGQVIDKDKRLTRIFYEQLDECISNI